MKISRTCLLGAMAGLMVAGYCAAQEPTLSTPVDQVSYLIGRQIGDSLAGEELANELNLEVLIGALRDAVAKKPNAIPPEKAQEVMQEFSTRMREKVTAVRQAQGEGNKKEGLAFLETNKTAEGWAVTGSGLQYKAIKNGDGKKPALTDTVEVHYRGTLLNGTEFDSSYKRNEPAVFPLRQVIKGWQEALQLMSVGSKWEVVLPSELAYGPNGKGREIGPDAVLKFEIELLSIKEAPPAVPAAPEAQK